MKINYNIKGAEGYMCFTDTDNAGKDIIWGIEAAYLPKLLFISKSQTHAINLVGVTYDRIRNSVLQNSESGYILV